MGNNFGTPDNVEVEHESGASRVFSSILCAICVAPILLLCMCGMLGWNERRAVCEAKAIDAGLEVAVQMGCTNPMEHNGDLVYMNCDLSKAGLVPLSPGGAFSNLQFEGTGLNIKAEMYQCIEHKNSETKKDKVGGGKTTVTTYTYSKGWSSNTETIKKPDSDNWRRNCGMANPSWPSDVPKSTTKYAPEVKVGAVTTTMTDKVPVNTPLSNSTSGVKAFSSPARWTQSGNQFSKHHSGGVDTIGDMRISFMGNDWTKPQVTLVGENKGGQIKEWKAPSAWLCSGFTVSDLLMGTKSKEDAFAELHAKANAMTWILRIVGFLVMWFAFSLCFAPLEVAADCIPCIGPCLGDSIACITCCVSCLPATACTLGVAGLVWCAMRPLIGIPMLIAWCVVMGGFGYFMATRKKKGDGLTSGEPMYGATQQMSVPFANQMAPESCAVAQPVVAVAAAVPQPRQIQVAVPAGCGPGSLVQVATPDGTQIQVAVPDGVQAGGFFMAQY